MALSPGVRLGPYEITGPLGAGGMGEVYRALDTRLEREVAIKVLTHKLALNPEALKRFEREAKAVAALSHPNILAIHDFGVEGDTRYAVTELLKGETLRELIARKEEIRTQHESAVLRERQRQPNRPLVDVLTEVLDDEDDSKPCLMCHG